MPSVVPLADRAIGNLQMWLSQWDPAGTSVGLWRQGPIGQMFGRFARRFDHASGKDAMYFDIDDGFFFGPPLNGQYPVTVRVVYLDVGTGRWALTYDAQIWKDSLVLVKPESGTTDHGPRPQPRPSRA